MTAVVVGAGLAGLRVCETLRRRGFSDRLVLIGDEVHAPYTRPPLSKSILLGDDPLSAQLRTDAELASLDIELQLGTPAVSLDAGGRVIRLADGAEVGFDDLVIATGARARRLPVALGPHLTLRTITDSVALREQLAPGTAVLVVGAGFIGLEAAASARQLGCEVTVVDLLPTPLARALPPEVGSAIQALHESNGVRFRLGVGITSVSDDSRQRVVTLSDGSTERASVVVVGVGVEPATEWLADSELTIDDGVVCTPSLRAGPRIWAVGDIARWTPPQHDSTVRVEHWTVASEMAEHVAGEIVEGTDAAFDTVPYMWSDQYDAKLQSVGFVTSGGPTWLVHGGFDQPRWAVLVRDGNHLGGVIGLRSPRQVMSARALLSARATWTEALATYPEAVDVSSARPR